MGHIGALSAPLLQPGDVLISGLLGLFFGQGFAIALTAAGSGASLCATGLGLLYLAGRYENTLQR